ncbi:alpha/beta hydrolase [Streptomyces sp. NPDC005435]|uniref:alpha/beta hydrolase n=1 Tax=Streptomyces sp. NPDC005435 TaxID=3154464 RepID=UPI0034540245
MSTTHVARPPFDPELGAVLSVLGKQLPNLTAETIRPMREMMHAEADLTGEALAKAGLVVREITIAGYEGADMAVSVISRADRTGPGPGIFHIHGGGMVLGHRMVGTVQFLPWILDHDAVLVTAEYRLAPEFPDPYPVEDCYAGLVWTAENAAELGIDPARIVIAGASAGGGLAAGTALLARDRRGPALLGQVLVCPMLDDRDETTSTHQYDDAGVWIRSSNRFGWGALLGERRGGDDVSIYAAPARATDLTGLPPTYIDCGSAEVFRDEDVAYASALWAAGVPAELHVWAGGFHGFELLAPHAAVSQAAAAARNDWVARLLAS